MRLLNAKSVACGFILLGISGQSIAANPFSPIRPAQDEAYSISPDLQYGDPRFSGMGMCTMDEAMAMIGNLEEEKIAKNPNSDLSPEVLGEWTIADIEASRYIGSTNGTKIYYNSEIKRYIKLKFDKENNNE